MIGKTHTHNFIGTTRAQKLIIKSVLRLNYKNDFLNIFETSSHTTGAFYFTNVIMQIYFFVFISFFKLTKT